MEELNGFRKARSCLRYARLGWIRDASLLDAPATSEKLRAQYFAKARAMVCARVTDYSRTLLAARSEELESGNMLSQSVNIERFIKERHNLCATQTFMISSC